MKKNKFNNNISFIKKAIDNDKLVVFAGAGVSKDSGIPLWAELIDEIRDYLNEDIKEDDPLKIAQILYNEKGEKEYNDIIKNSLYKNKGIYNSLHEVIFDLNPQHIITTNYDSYFENVIENKGLPFSVVSKDIDLPYAEHKNLLIKYHGDFENKNIVFKETDYLEFSKNNTLKEIFVKSLFSNKVILFIGYRVGDINLKLLIKDIQFILTKHHQRAYLLNHKSEITESEIKYFENLGINIINYCEESLNSLKAKDKLSAVGGSVFKQLEYIRDFDLFEYDRRKSDKSSKSKLIDDLFTSLNRFYYYRVLPKSLLASLYPLNKNSKNDTIYNIESNTLFCYYQELYDLINNYKGKEDINLGEEDKHKLNFSIARLLYSNIYYFGNKVGGKDSLGNRRTDKKINLSDKYYSESEKCDCVNCSIGYFKYSDAILKIERYKITDDSKLWDDLTFSYSLYELGEYYKSYKSYEQIELKSNRLKQMDVSFVSSYNMKRIGMRIHGFHLLDKRYSFDDLKEIENHAKKIDLDKELSKIKYFVDQDVYRFLREVRDGIYIQRLCNDIDDFYDKIPKDVKIVQRGGSVSNSDYFNLYNAVKQLNDFLAGNFIIGNGFSAIEHSINKSIKTFILGFYVGTLKINQHQKRLFGISKLDSFDSFLFELIINYNNPEELSYFIKEQNISEIKFDKESQASVFLFITNFLKSAYEENTFFGGNGRNDVFNNYLNYNCNFEQIVLKQFKNICIVLSYFEFSESQVRNIYSILNQFIKFVDFRKYNDLKFLKLFIDTKFGIIGSDLLMETLNILNSQKRQYDDVYISILKKLKGLNHKFINEGFIVENFTNVEYGVIRYEIPIIYMTLPDNKKNEFIKRVENKLSEEFNSDIVYVLLFEKIPVKKDIKDKYVNSLHHLLVTKGKETKEISPDSYFLNPIKQYFELINLEIINDKKLSSLKIEIELFKFIINPENYNKDKFDPEWLKIFYYDSYIKKFSKIGYIIEKLESCLIDNDDEKLKILYFKLLKYRKD